jgi:hypothetical protein
MALEKLPPRSITVLSRKPGRPDDVGEQDRGQDPVRFGHRPGTGDELLDLADECVLVASPHQLIRPGKLHVPGVLDVVGNVAPVPGLAAWRSYRDSSSTSAASASRLGANRRSSIPLPHVRRVRSITMSKFPESNPHGQIVHPLLDGRQFRRRDGIGHAGAALVEGQHAVHRSVAHQLVRDVQAVVPRVPRLRKRHRRSLAAEARDASGAGGRRCPSTSSARSAGRRRPGRCR